MQVRTVEDPRCDIDMFPWLIFFTVRPPPFPFESIHVTEKWGFWPSRKILCLDILRPNVHPLSFIPSLVFAAHPYAHAWDGIMSVIDMLTVNKHSPCSKDKTNGPRSSSTIQDKSSEKGHRYLPDVINAIWTPYLAYVSELDFGHSPGKYFGSSCARNMFVEIKPAAFAMATVWTYSNELDQNIDVILEFLTHDTSH